MLPWSFDGMRGINYARMKFFTGGHFGRWGRGIEILPEDLLYCIYD